MKLWHVTPTRNVFNILEQGLLPGIGSRSEELGESVARIYVFTEQLALEDALSNWLGEAFDDDEALSIVVLDVAKERLTIPVDLYEAYILDTVEPTCIVRIVAEQEWGLLQRNEPEGTVPRESNFRL